MTDTLFTFINAPTDDSEKLFSAGTDSASRNALAEISFITCSNSNLDEADYIEISDLFSENYGRWSKQAPSNSGQQIKLSPRRIRDILDSPDTFIAMARDHGRLVGHAIYLRKEYDNIGYVTWVLQLVIHQDYRRIGIATKLLNSIWGFSNDAAWGLATVNPLTIKTLEKATLRKCNPRSIKKNLDIIKQAQQDVYFAQGRPLDITDNHSLIDTRFFIDLDQFQNLYDAYGGNWILGEINPGQEWLAFTFQYQKASLDPRRFEDIVQNSESILKEAYSRMIIQDQPWATHTRAEVDWILSTFPPSAGPLEILDLGCGQGRHSLEFAQQGHSCLGVDFSETHIQFAQTKAHELGLQDKAMFQMHDVRSFGASGEFDLGLLLYDVVGSFPHPEDNRRLVLAARDNIRSGGTLVLSVMNFELTRANARFTAGNITELVQKITDLEPSDTMQRTGDIFNPAYYIINEEDKLVYRKEQFTNDNKLSSELILRDKRFCMDEIVSLVEDAGFEVQEKRYVQAGRFQNALPALDPKAKEILLVARKK